MMVGGRVHPREEVSYESVWDGRELIVPREVRVVPSLEPPQPIALKAEVEAWVQAHPQRSVTVHDVVVGLRKDGYAVSADVVSGAMVRLYKQRRVEREQRVTSSVVRNSTRWVYQWKVCA